jgi:hypothetical protein
MEGRRMLSAGVFGADAGSVWEDGRAAVVEAPARVAPLVVVRSVKYPQVVGRWEGTCKVAGVKGSVAVSMELTSQKKSAAVGRFSLGPITGGRTVVSTAIVGSGKSRDFRVILKGNGFYGSVAAAVSKNGKEIMGRWSVNGPGGWKVGTVVLVRR